MTNKSLPTIPGYSWQSLAPTDYPILNRFELDCSRLDGATNLTSEAGWTEKLDDALIAVAAINAANEFAAVGFIEDAPGAGVERAFLDGRVHPDFRGRGIGSALLAWLEAEASAHLLAKDSDLPRVLRIMFWDRDDDATVLFEQHGFEFHYIEEEMRVDLKEPRPDLPLPPGLTVELWSPENAPDFYTVYRGAYGTRTDNPLSESAWTKYWANPDYYLHGHITRCRLRHRTFFKDDRSIPSSKASYICGCTPAMAGECGTDRRRMTYDFSPHHPRLFLAASGSRPISLRSTVLSWIVPVWMAQPI